MLTYTSTSTFPKIEIIEEMRRDSFLTLLSENVMATSYRMNTEADEYELIDLWTNSSDWGNISVAEWERTFMRTPLGPASFVLAISDQSQEIVAQLAFIPCLVNVNGKEVQGCRPFAVIVNEEFRSKTGFLRMQQMIIKMYSIGAEFFAEQGFEVLFMVPDSRWARIIKMNPLLHSATFPLWSCPLPRSAMNKLPVGYSVERMDPGDSRVNELWPQASKLYKCMVVRDTRLMPWKISHGECQLFGVFYGESIIGMFVCSKKRDSHQWLITDFLSIDSDEAMKATLQAACQATEELHSKLSADEQSVYHKIAVLGTPIMEPVLKELGFIRDKYDFLLIVHALNKKLTKEQVAPAQWYVSAND